MTDQKQTSRFSKAEMEIIKNTFQNEGLIYAIRNVFYQFPLSDNDQSQLKNLPATGLAIIKKIFLLNISPDAPLTFQVDSYFPLIAIQQMNPAMAILHIESKDLQVEYLQQRYDELYGNELSGKKIILTDLKEKVNKNEQTRYIEMLAYLHLCSTIDDRLNTLKIKANAKEETEEEKKARQAKDSTE